MFMFIIVSSLATATTTPLDDFETDKILSWKNITSGANITRTNNSADVFQGTWAGHVISNNYNGMYYSAFVSPVNASLSAGNYINLTTTVKLDATSCQQVMLIQNGSRAGYYWTGGCFGVDGGRLDTVNSTGGLGNSAGNSSCSALPTVGFINLTIGVSYFNTTTRQVLFRVVNATSGVLLCNYNRLEGDGDGISHRNVPKGVNWTGGLGSGQGAVTSHYFDYVVIADSTPAISSISFVSPTPNNNTALYFNNNNIILNTTIVNTGGVINTTQNVYYENGSLFQTITNSSSINTTNSFNY